MQKRGTKDSVWPTYICATSAPIKVGVVTNEGEKDHIGPNK